MFEKVPTNDAQGFSEPPSEWDQSNYFQKWTFSVANRLIKQGLLKPLQLEDLFVLSTHDRSERLITILKKNYETSEKISFIPRLMVAMLRSHVFECSVIVFYTLIEGAVRVALPVVLRVLLEALGNPDDWKMAYVWAGVLGALGVVQCLVHHILFFYSMRLGWNWKSSCTGLIYDRLFSLSSATLASHSTGKLVNLISNDVARFEEFAVFACFTWESLLELLAILLILINIVGVAPGFAGVGMTLVFIPVQVILAKQFASMRSQTAAATDQRVRYTSEVIDGITSVKSYGWEKPFYDLIGNFRGHETHFIGRSQTLRAINQGLFYCAPPVAGFATFAVFWGMGGTLTLPIVFSTLSLLQTLRMTIGRQWTRSIETGSEAIASCYRIENYLDFVDTQKLSEPKSLEGSQLVPNVSDNENKDTMFGVEMVSHDISKPPTLLLEMKNCSYYYGESVESPVLRGVGLEVSRGELVMVVGPVGAGKSSLLSAILGEIRMVPNHSTSTSESCDQTEAHMWKSPSSRIAYCAQRPWILAASVRANIALAGHNNTNTDMHRVEFKRPTSLNEDLYGLSVDSCHLMDDMMQWPAFDDTEVGERGISISGGQKARLALARAVYSDADLFLLDDPLSAVDAHVGQALFNDCIVGAMKARGKGVVLATHQLQYLRYADRVVVLGSQGHQLFSGNFADLQSRLSEFPFLNIPTGDGEESHSDANLPSGSSRSIESSSEKSESSTKGVSDIAVTLEGDSSQSTLTVNITMQDTSDDAATKDSNSNSNHTNNRYDASKRESLVSSSPGKRAIVQAEDRVEGKMSILVFWRYIMSGGMVRGLWTIFLLVMSQILLMIDDYWLRWWAGSTFGGQRDLLYILVFAGLTLFCILLGFYRALTWFEFTLGAATHLHEASLWSVMHSPLTFFVANPTGRILNRFSRDQNQADELMPVTLFDFLQCALFCLAGVVLVCISLPWLILMMPFLVYGFMVARNKYIVSTREVKRIEAVTRSPIYADFSATLEGLVTLRAYNLRGAFTTLFQKEIDENGRAYFSFLLCARWLGFRLDTLSAVILIAIAILAVVLRNSVDVGLIGFALVYTMTLSGLFQWTVRQSAEVEAQMTAIERISAYGALPPEDGYSSTLKQHVADVHAWKASANKMEDNNSSVNEGKDNDEGNKNRNRSRSNSSSRGGVPTGHRYQLVPREEILAYKGDVNLSHLTVTYRQDLDPVLKDLCAHFPAGSKVGVCGRTGCGKSSTLLALLRLNIIVSGDILVDGESLLQMDLEKSRSLVSVIPQDPHLFSGTVRFNLDPFRLYTDQQVWDALGDAHIADHISRDEKGLDFHVDEGGKNFSVGQRQLLSLARAILRHSPVILMDEVTASIDYTTDKLIQETIRTSPALRSSTIITVAHRLRTIADSDMIVVINQGKVFEVGPPIKLLETQDSIFHALAVESNEFDDICGIARNAFEKSANHSQK